MAQSYLDSELYLPGAERARFSWAGHEYEGAPALQSDRIQELFALESTPDEYGRELFAGVFPAGSALREGLHDAILEAERAKSRLRLRLNLSPELPERIHALYWELLADPVHRLALARSPDTAFSRYSAVPRPLGTPTTGRPRLLCVVSAPRNVEKYQMARIDREDVLRHIEASLSDVDVEVTVLEPPATPGRIRERLVAGDFHLLHLFGHGMIQRQGVSALVLEDEQGQVRFVEEELLAEVFLGDRDLRLVTVVACHGGALSSADGFSGLAGRLVQRGLPAVIAMRRAVSVDKAHVFTDHLYRQLARTGRVDAAVNEARQQLYLAEPQGIAWSSPVLYQRLADGRLWLPPAETPEEPEETAAASAPLLRFSPRRLLRPLPWVPAFLFVVALVLSAWTEAETAVRLDLHVSQLAFRLAKACAVVESLRLEEIAATRLAALRMPSGEWIRGGGRTMEGFLLTTQTGGAAEPHATLRVLPQQAGARISFEHQDGRGYRMALTGSDQEVNVTFQGDVVLKRLAARALPLRFDTPGSLTIVPQSGALDADLVFSRFEGDEIAAEIPIDRLSLVRVEEQHTAAATVVTQQPTILTGEVTVLSTGRRHRLAKGEALRFDAVTGTLAHLRLGEDGIRFQFRGQAVKLERAAAGLPPVSLMPSILDKWITGPAQGLLLKALAAVALMVLFLSAVELRLRFRNHRRPAHGSPLRSEP